MNSDPEKRGVEIAPGMHEPETERTNTEYGNKYCEGKTALYFRAGDEGPCIKKTVIGITNKMQQTRKSCAADFGRYILLEKESHYV